MFYCRYLGGVPIIMTLISNLTILVQALRVNLKLHEFFLEFLHVFAYIFIKFDLNFIKFVIHRVGKKSTIGLGE